MVDNFVVEVLGRRRSEELEVEVDVDVIFLVMMIILIYLLISGAIIRAKSKCNVVLLYVCLNLY